MHLTPEQLTDLVEGTRDETSAAHLADCAACRQVLAETRLMLASVSQVEVPEPSPLFWDHFSARVGEAVAADGEARARWFAAPWIRVSAAALALAVLFVALGPRLMAPLREGRATAPVVATAGPLQAAHGDSFSDSLSSPEDPSLELVAQLTDMVAADGDVDLGPRGSADHAVSHLTGGELQELRRLLGEELAHAGA